MKGIIDYLEKTSALFPQKTAIADINKRLTFSELASQSRSVGAELHRLCISGKPVPVFVNRSSDTLVAFLGVAYSGCFYVPIDPAMPPEKIKTVLYDCQAEVVLGTPENLQLFSSLEYDCRFIDYTSLPDAIITAPEVAADTPLYMVYTSGSTGKPKGVLKSHGAVISFIEAFTETFGLGSEEIIGNQTPFFFDASAKDIFLSLATGATLEVIPSEYFMLPTALIQYMNERQITYICWVPTALSMVIQMHAFRKVMPETLKKVFFVGEVFPIKQLRAWTEALPELYYVNLYGSSEIAGISCFYPIDTSAVPDLLPMGKALSNCEVFLSDEGEVITASPSLALEYYNDPVKTAGRFTMMKTPSGEVRRVLMTGDLARYDDDGNLVFVSRKDFQIKHLGKRIELGEIEAVADSLAEIQRCCCIYDSALQQIKLFCELIPGCDLTGKDIRDLLRPRLSDYMLPQKVTVLEKMPFNANGKINRTALSQM